MLWPASRWKGSWANLRKAKLGEDWPVPCAGPLFVMTAGATVAGFIRPGICPFSADREALMSSSALAERLRAAIRLLYPDDMTPQAKRVLESILDDDGQEGGGSDNG